MYWLLQILDRDVKELTHFTCVQLRIPSTCIPPFKGLFVHLSPASSSVTVLGTLWDTRIPRELNSRLLLGDFVTFRK